MATLPPDTRVQGSGSPAPDFDALVDCVAIITGATPGSGTVTTQQTLNTLAAAVTASQVLAGNGTNITLRALTSADLPFTLPLSRANGGTAATTTPAAPQNYNPANPTATASTTLVMMGLGTTCVFTPASSGNVKITVTGNTLTNTAAAQITLGGRYGTGTAPANGAAVTGTRFGASTDQAIRAANFNAGVPFCIDAILGLSPGTAYWFDIALATNAGADTAQIASAGCTIFELS